MCMRFNHSEDLDIDGMILEWILKNVVERVWTGSCLGIETSGRLL